MVAFGSSGGVVARRRYANVDVLPGSPINSKDAIDEWALQLQTFTKGMYMAGIRMFEDQLRLMTPHTFVGLQRLVTSMADVVNKAGRTTWFGKDRGEIAYSKFLEALKITLHALIIDGVVSESNSTEEVLDALNDKLNKFSMAFPNWQEAYLFAARFFGQNKVDALSTLERLRSQP